MQESQEGYKVICQLINTDKIMNDLFWKGVYPGMKRKIIDYMITHILDLIK